MKKILSYITAAALIACASGCNSGKPETENTMSTTTTAAVTEAPPVSVTASDDAPAETGLSQDVIDYLSSRAPYYAQYAQSRCSLPLTFETIVPTDEGSFRISYFIKNNKTFAKASIDPDGYEDRSIYKEGKQYDVYGKDKTTYYRTPKESDMQAYYDSYIFKISLDQVKKCEYSSDEAEFNGVKYKHEQIRPNGTERKIDYYFDMDTGKLRYISSDSGVTEITVLENNVKDSDFDIPSDYELVYYQDYVNSIASSMREEFAQSREAENAVSE